MAIPRTNFRLLLTRAPTAKLSLAARLIAPGRSPVPVAAWLLCVAGMVLVMILIGGYTRLSGSGLSMTRWKPVGYRYPRTSAEWQHEFELYKQYPEYAARPDTTLAQFQRIFNVEYLHRVFGNAIGVVFTAPMLYFWSRGYFTAGMKRRGCALLAAGGLQGVVGWWMVRSGLSSKPEYQTRQRVSVYRLVVHHAMALSVYAYTLLTGLRLLPLSAAELPAAVQRPAFRVALLLAHLLALNLLSGAAAAGVAAGEVFNTWPLMNGRFVPEGYWRSELGWRNLFENKACVQFNHRILAYATYVVAVVGFARLCRLPLPRRLAAANYLVLLHVHGQLLLGIAMICGGVDTQSGLLHQGNGLLALSAVVLLLALSAR